MGDFAHASVDQESLTHLFIKLLKIATDLPSKEGKLQESSEENNTSTHVSDGRVPECVQDDDCLNDLVGISHN